MLTSFGSLGFFRRLISDCRCNNSEPTKKENVHYKNRASHVAGSFFLSLIYNMYQQTETRGSIDQASVSSHLPTPSVPPHAPFNPSPVLSGSCDFSGPEPS